VTGGRLDGVASDAISSELARLSGLVEDMLLLARADVQRTTDLRVSAAIAPVKVMGNPAQLTRLVRNLIDNAARYAESSVHLELRVDDARRFSRCRTTGPAFPRTSGSGCCTGSSGSMMPAPAAAAASAWRSSPRSRPPTGGVVRVGDGPGHTGARLVVELPAVVILEEVE
jgi:hypothetical protein